MTLEVHLPSNIVPLLTPEQRAIQQAKLIHPSSIVYDRVVLDGKVYDHTTCQQHIHVSSSLQETTCVICGLDFYKDTNGKD